MSRTDCMKNESNFNKKKTKNEKKCDLTNMILLFRVSKWKEYLHLDTTGSQSNYISS